MFIRSAALALGMVAFLVLATQSIAAEKTHEGTFVSATADKLVMSTDGKEHSHAIGATTKITIGGKPGKLTDLKKGDKIAVTMDGDKVVEVSKK